MNFKQTKFYITVDDLRFLPTESIAEVAIVGRSNAGKSSLINVLTNQNKLAFTSKTPGRTQHINYFSVGINNLFLVDLPGYGYAKVPEKFRVHWEELLSNYLISRKQLLGLVIIMDIRHPLKELDYKMLEFFASTNKPFHIVLSKEDKLNHQQRQITLQFVLSELAKKNYKNYSVQLFSALKKTHVFELEEKITKLFENV